MKSDAAGMSSSSIDSWFQASSKCGAASASVSSPMPLSPARCVSSIRRLPVPSPATGGLFYRLARRYFEPAEATERQEELLEHEARIIEALPIRPVVH